MLTYVFHTPFIKHRTSLKGNLCAFLNAGITDLVDICKYSSANKHPESDSCDKKYFRSFDIKFVRQQAKVKNQNRKEQTGILVQATD